jgi:nicotinamidase-related amidase
MAEQLPAALLLVDIQQGLDDPRYGSRNNPDAEQRIAELLAAWRESGRPVIHVQHMSTQPHSAFRPELSGNAFKPEALPVAGEPVFQKTVNSAFIGTALERYLHENDISSLVIAGMCTDQCVSSTVRNAENLGFKVTIAEDATATFERRGPDGVLYSADLMHKVELASLHEECATIRSTREILADA